MSFSVNGMPLVGITKAEVDKKLSCTVCYEDFTVDERVVRLPCSHVFHDTCITTWLERRNTCPNCRKQLGDVNEETLSIDYSLSDEDVISVADSFDGPEAILDLGDIEDELDNELDEAEFELSVMDTSGEEQSSQSVVLWDTVREGSFLTFSSDSEDSIEYCQSNSSFISISMAMNIE